MEQIISIRTKLNNQGVKAPSVPNQMNPGVVCCGVKAK